MSFPAAPASERKHAVQAQSLIGSEIGVERFVAIEAGELDFGCRRQPQVRALEMKHVRCEFRQLAHAGQRRRVHDEGRKNFRVSVCRVRIEKKRSQGAFQARAEAAIDRKTRAGHFRGALEIENPGAFGDFPMRARLEIKFRRRAPAAHLDIRRSIVPHRHGTVRAVGHGQHEIRELRVQHRDAFVGQLDFVRRPASFPPARRRRLRRPSCAAQFPRWPCCARPSIARRR